MTIRGAGGSFTVVGRKRGTEQHEEVSLSLLAFFFGCCLLLLVLVMLPPAAWFRLVAPGVRQQTLVEGLALRGEVEEEGCCRWSA